MNSDLSRIARASLDAAPQPPQRYGLSVFLRKAYPTLVNREQGTRLRPAFAEASHFALRATRDRSAGRQGYAGQAGDRGTTLRVRGAEVEQTTWDDLPRELAELVRKRVADDSLVAFHVLRATNLRTIRVAGERSINLNNLVTSGAASTLFVDIAPYAKLVIHENPESAITRDSTSAEESDESGGAYSSAVVLLRVGEGVRVQWFGQSVSAPGFAVVERLAILARDAVLEQHSVLLAANALRENVHVVLDAPGATARINTLFVGSRDHQFDLGVTAEHRVPHTVSNLAAKGVLSGKAQAVVRGLVRVEREAPGSDGYQRCDTLLLSPGAEVDPIPNLEINTNDVRCTHGVTTGHLNPEQLFYLQSRGLSGAAAQDLLVGGFAATMLRSYPERQRQRLEQSMKEIFSHAET